MGGNLHGGREIVDCLVKAGADINTVDSNGRTVLFDVAGLPSRINQERVSTLKYLLGAGASKESRDFQGRTISHEIVKGLLSHNDIDTMVQGLDVLDSLGLFDLEAVDNAGNSLLHELCSCVQYARNGRNVDVQLVRLLTGAGLDMSRKNYAGQTPLHLLCARPCKSGSSWFAFDQPIAYAIHKCENIDERDSIGNTALHIASVYEESWCKLLLDAGADPTVLNYDGLTPLHLAARAKQSNIIGMLLKAVHDRLRDTPSEENDLLNATVVKYRYNVYDEPFKVTALFYACMSGRPESVKLLLDAGADPNIGNLFVACATMEQENRLWTEEEHAPRTAIAALRPFDTTRPPRPALEHLSDILHPFASTRLDEILEMLVSAGIELSLLYCAPSMGCGNPFLKAADLHSSYALKCLSAIRKKHSGKVEDKSESVPSQVPQQGLYLFDDKMAACSDDASKSMMRQSGWLQPEGVDFEIFRAAIVRRQYHLITQMVELGCRFLLPGIRHLEYLISHGFASLFDKIAEAETQARLADGEWSAFGDPTKPGLHFREETKQNERAQFDTYEEEARNKMLEYSLKRALPNMDIVQLLVDKYAVNINGVSRDNNTALHIIARGHHWWQGAQALPFFLKSGADIECRNSIGQTPLHLALDKKYLPLGYLGPFHKDVAEVLVHAGADINAVDSQGRSCLDLAGYSTELVDLLISNGAVVRSSSIFAALEADNATALKKLLQAGVGANGRMPYVEDHLREEDRPDRCYLGDDCMTFDLARIPRHEMVPLYYVASKPTFPEDPDTRGCFRTLLKHGADIYATFHVLPTRREVARAYGGDFNKLLGIIEANDGEAGRRSVLHELVRLGKLSKCVIDAVDIDAGCLDSKGCTLLHAVCDSWGGPDGVINTTSDNDDDDAEDADENITAFKQLLAIGCDIQARDNNGQSIVHHMIYSGWKHPFQLGRLKKSLEEISLIAPNLLSAPNASGNTPLHYSTLLATPTRKIITVDCRVYEPIQAQQGLMVELTRLLLRHGASPAGANQDGNSVLHFMARNLDRKDVAAQFAELVRDHGLDVNARNALGETPLMLLANRTAVLLRSCTGGNSGLDYSLYLDSEAAAERVAMLAALGADFQVTDEHGNGLLHLAATDGVQLFKAVMDRGALDPTMENHAHQTAIDVAAAYNNNEILALFEKKT
ncbi:ankyrin 2,3/unc44 [Cordyceps javanica]|uniref:Ankyrin 2,3/unc44 n=1 Tax=Cordyceps javanica TaxID=43265 RepID=A0A545VHG3_9HYPO|nr:ankyrin 2,3/unc44 [Cordyceps javanica]TQW12321.1 ankyrin 2,3/unc44 [Cordyceps javanica]